jgi:hypothetical protein
MRTPRDAQFARFAHLLLADLVRADPSFWPTLVARRVYDLLWHTLARLDPALLDSMPLAHVMRTLPDLAAWPDETEAQYRAWLSTRPDPACVEQALTRWRAARRAYGG